MNYEEISTLWSRYSECTKCALSGSRQANSENVCLGQGALSPVGLFIVPQPAHPVIAVPSPLGHSSEERSMMSSIFEKAGLDDMEWFTTTAVMCRTAPNDQFISPEYILACNERLKALVASLKPKVVVLGGPEAFYSFYGVKGSQSYGWILLPKSDYKVMYLMDPARYIQLRDSGDLRADAAAIEIMSYWKQVSEYVSEISG